MSETMGQSMKDLGLTPEGEIPPATDAETGAATFKDIQTPEMAARLDEWRQFTQAVDGKVANIDKGATRLSALDTTLTRAEQATLQALSHAGYGPEIFYSAPYDHLTGPAGHGAKSTAERVQAGETTYLDEAKQYIDRDINVSATVAGTMLREAYLNGEFKDFDADNPYPLEIYPILAAATTAEAQALLGDAKSPDELQSNSRDRYKALKTTSGVLSRANNPEIYKGYSVTVADKIRGEMRELLAQKKQSK